MYQYDENIYIVQHHGYHLIGAGSDGWSDGEIPDSAFVNAIQYLIKEGIIKI